MVTRSKCLEKLSRWLKVFVFAILAVIDTQGARVEAISQSSVIKMHELVAKTHKIHALLRRRAVQNNNNNNNTRNAWLASNNCYNLAAALARFCYTHISRVLSLCAHSIRSERTKEAQHLCLTPRYPLAGNLIIRPSLPLDDTPFLHERYNDDDGIAAYTYTFASLNAGARRNVWAVICLSSSSNETSAIQ